MQEVFFDSIGWTYIGLAIVWNVLFVAGLRFLWTNRHVPSVRMRKIPLLFVGLTLLHFFGNTGMISYPLSAILPCEVIYWCMSLYLPLGMALFQAANSQYLHLASRQKQFARMSTIKDQMAVDEKRAHLVANSRWRRIFAGLERSDNIGRTLFLIGVGMAVQVVLVLFVFLATKRYHRGWGLFPSTLESNDIQSLATCSKGWELWLSIVWQFFWAWIYAPYMLWKSRGVRDVHGWRTQTILCCLVQLPATPGWLASAYIPQMATFNRVFPPPVWYSICIFFMEVFTIGFPIVGIIKGRALRDETLEAVADWKRRRETEEVAVGSTSLNSPSLYSTESALKVGTTVNLSAKRSSETLKSDMLTMTALENALRTNALPLLEFAALKDFSGENVSFLTLVADWRRYWLSPKSSTADHRRKQFIAAVRIYSYFISLEFSEFPINISSREMKRMHIIFEKAAALLDRSTRNSLSSETSDSVSPFENSQHGDRPESPKSFGSKIEMQPTVTNLDSLGRANLRAASRMNAPYAEDALTDVHIPDEFNEMVFDSAEHEIKYLVLTNTWPKFVNAGRAASQLSIDDEEKASGWRGKLLCSD